MSTLQNKILVTTTTKYLTNYSYEIAKFIIKLKNPNKSPIINENFDENPKISKKLLSI